MKRNQANLPEHVLHPFNNPRIISVCTGMGGLERGMQRVIGSIHTVAYVEIEAFIIENLLSLMEQGVLSSAPVWADATTFSAELFHNRVHGIAGGYPCQDESVAGELAGAKGKRFIWHSIEQIIKAVDPIWCFFENVENHLHVSYPIVQASLRSLGYRVEESIHSAGEVGAPHGRKRVFILAVKMAYSGSLGSKARLPEQVERKEGLSRELKHSGYKNIWPAPPECNQHKWEEPRAVKPGMGCTVNGYNFRDDLLRMYGNAVVEQQAELAFRTLLEKHGIPLP